MNIALIVLTAVFLLLNIVTSKINYNKDHSGYSSDFDFFWLDNCLVFREMEALFFAIAVLTSFFLVDHTCWGPVIWGFVALSGLSANGYMSRSHWDWYRNYCWKNEKKHYLKAFIISVLSNLIWLFIIITVVSKFVMFVLEAEPWNR